MIKVARIKFVEKFFVKLTKFLKTVSKNWT